MENHKFTVGQAVQFKPNAFERMAPRGAYRIVRLMPAEDHDNRYWIKSTQERHERVASESQLDRAASNGSL